MREQGVVRVISKIFIPFILLFALYVQFHGDYGPGGGFQAGVIFGAGFILYALIFGLAPMRKVASTRMGQILMALGLILYAGVGVVSMIKGANFLDYNVLEHDPVHGQHLGILLVELGVGITVSATMVSIFMNFARRGRR